MANGKMKQIVSKIMIGTFAAAASFLLLSNLPAVSVPVNADSEVAINEENFTDENFRKYVSDNCDKNKNGYLSSSEIAQKTSIDVNNKGISSLKGIEHFTALTKLNCQSNQLTSLDVSKCTSLKTIYCSNNQLTSIDISKNTELSYFYCGNNQLTSIDISKNTELSQFSCDHNPLTSLDVCKNTKLNYLWCSNINLTSLDVSMCTSLVCLDCPNNQLSKLDVSKCTALVELYCYDNQLTSLDVSKNTALTHLACFNNKILKICIGNCSSLLDTYAVGENTTDNYYRIPDTAVKYIDYQNYILIDRQVRFFTSILEPGWNKDNGDWIYIFDNESFATGWQQINHTWYFFDEIGIMQTGWVKEGDTWYYLKSSGAMATGWEQASGIWYYFGNNGKMVTDWQQIEGTYYCFKSSGAMASDEYIDGYYLDKSGAWTYKYRASWKSDSTGTYFQDTNGWYPKNQWLKIDDQWYFFTPAGYKAVAEYWNGYWFNLNGTWTYTVRASWKQDSNGWWYGDDTGWYAKNDTIKINGKLYNFNAEGYCTNP